MNGGTMKTCNKCGETKTVADFYVSRWAKDGLQNYCKECTKRASMAWARSNPDKRRKSSKVAKRRERLPAIEAMRADAV